MEFLLLIGGGLVLLVSLLAVSFFAGYQRAKKYTNYYKELNKTNETMKEHWHEAYLDVSNALESVKESKDRLDNDIQQMQSIMNLYSQDVESDGENG